jgi:hypothetical protein
LVRTVASNVAQNGAVVVVGSDAEIPASAARSDRAAEED